MVFFFAMLAFAMPAEFTAAQVAAIAALANLELDPSETRDCSRGSSATSSRTPTRFSRSTRPACRRRRASSRAARVRSRRRGPAVARSRRGAGQRAGSGARATPDSSRCRGSSDDHVRRPFARFATPSARARARPWTSAATRSRASTAADPSLHAFNTVTREQALARAADIDRDRDRWRDAPLAGVPDRAQGQPLHARRADDRLVAHARARSCRPTTPPSSRASSGRRRRHRQDQLRRVRDGLVHRELGVRPVAQSLGARSHSRRIERRIGRRGGRRHDAARARVRHRRIHPAAGGDVRRRRPEADLRPRVALRPARVRLVARSDRPADAHGPRRRARARRHRRRRSGGRRRARRNRCPTTRRR